MIPTQAGLRLKTTSGERWSSAGHISTPRRGQLAMSGDTFGGLNRGGGGAPNIYRVEAGNSVQPPTMPKDVPPTQNYLAPNVREPCSRGTNRIIPIYRRGREAQRGEVSCPKSQSQEPAEPQFEARLPDLRVHAPRSLPQDHPMRQVLLLIHAFQMGKRYRAGGGTEPVCHRAKKARSQELDPEHRRRGT